MEISVTIVPLYFPCLAETSLHQLIGVLLPELEPLGQAVVEQIAQLLGAVGDGASDVFLMDRLQVVGGLLAEMGGEGTLGRTAGERRRHSSLLQSAPDVSDDSFEDVAAAAIRAVLKM